MAQSCSQRGLRSLRVVRKTSSQENLFTLYGRALITLEFLVERTRFTNRIAEENWIPTQDTWKILSLLEGAQKI